MGDLGNFRGIFRKFQNGLPNVKKSGPTNSPKNKETGVSQGKALVAKSLSHYRNARLETAAEELVSIWFKTKSNSSAFRGVPKAIHLSGPLIGKVYPNRT